MSIYEKNNLILLSGLIYKINSIESDQEMRKVFLQCLYPFVPYNLATFYLADSTGNGKLCNPIGVNLSEEELQSYFDYEGQDYRKWVFLATESTVFKESEMYPEEKRNQTIIHQKLHIPKKIYYCLQLSLVYHSCFLGVVSLYRTKDEGDFLENEVFILNLIKDHLALRLYPNIHSKTSFSPKSPKITEYEKKYEMTKKEIEVLELLLKGHTNDEISAFLYISPNTLRKHLTHIYKKIGISSRWELFKHIL